MEKTIKKWILTLCILTVWVAGNSSVAYGASLTPSIIRVGLRSAYSNQASITVKNNQLEVGYTLGDQFISDGIVTSNNGYLIKPSNKTYYTNNLTYSSYNQAAYSVREYNNKGIKAVVAYGGIGTWRIFTEKNLGGMWTVVPTNKEVILQDGLGTDLILCENNGITAAFAGKSPTHDFYLTELDKGLYRGWFEFVREGSGITAVNAVDHEQYLYGVIPAEMPASWNEEALKAQAVAARSMSVYQFNKYIQSGYNVCDTVYTQVYKGFSGEHPRTNQAVDETKGQVVTYNGRVAETLFFSTSGGYTEDPQYVWGNEVDYLKAVPDHFETEPEGKPWVRSISLAEIDLCLAKQRVNIGQATGIRINSFTPAGRVNELEILGTEGTHKLYKENVRTFFAGTTGGSLRSRMFNIGTWALRPSNESFVGNYGDVVISGQGYGHGVGMSQSGARGMAKEGYTYDEIIKYYYQDVEIQGRINEDI